MANDDQDIISITDDENCSQDPSKSTQKRDQNDESHKSSNNCQLIEQRIEQPSIDQVNQSNPFQIAETSNQSNSQQSEKKHVVLNLQELIKKAQRPVLLKDSQHHQRQLAQCSKQGSNFNDLADLHFSAYENQSVQSEPHL